MHALPAIRRSRAGSSSVPTASSTGAVAPPGKTRKATQLAPVVQQRPSKPLAAGLDSHGKSPDPKTGRSSSTALSPVPPPPQPHPPTLVYLPRPVPRTSSGSSSSSTASATPAVATRSEPEAVVVRPPPSLAETADLALERLTVLCVDFMAALSPATESALRLRTPLSAVLDDLHTARRSQECGATRTPCVTRVAVVGPSPLDRHALLAFLWYGSVDSAGGDRDGLSEASVAGGDASLISSSSPPLSTVKKTRSTRPSSFRSTSSYRAPLGLLPFPTSSVSGSQRFAPPHTPPLPGLVSASGGYDQRLIYSPTEASTGAYPSSVDDSVIYCSGGGFSERDAMAWSPGSPQMDVVQLFTPTSPSRSPMGSSLQLPAAPHNPHVRASKPSHPIARTDDLHKATATLSASVGSVSPRGVDSGGGSGGLNTLVQRFTAGINQFTHHQRVLSSDTEGSTCSPPMGPASNPPSALSDRLAELPLGLYTGSPVPSHGQSLLFAAANSPRNPVATDSDGAAWEGLLDLPRTRADTLPTPPADLLRSAANPQMPCTSQLQPSPRLAPGSGNSNRAATAGATDTGGSPRRASGSRNRAHRRTICIQTNTFTESALDLAQRAAAAAARADTGADPGAGPGDGARQAAGPAVLAAFPPRPPSATNSETPLSAIGGQRARTQRASSVHVSTPPPPQRTTWVLQEQDQAVVFPEMSVAAQSLSSAGDKPPWAAAMTSVQATSTSRPTPTALTGDAFFVCLPCNHVGRPTLGPLMRLLLGPDAAAPPPPPPPRSPRSPVPLVPTPPTNAPTAATAAVMKRPSSTFQRQKAPTVAVMTGAAESTEASGAALRHVRQLIVSQAFFVLTGTEAIDQESASVAAQHSAGSETPGATTTTTTLDEAAATSASSSSSFSAFLSPLASSIDNLVTLFCTQLQNVFGVTVERWQVIPFSASTSIVARDFLLAYSHSRCATPPPPAAAAEGVVGITPPGIGGPPGQPSLRSATPVTVSSPRSQRGSITRRNGGVSPPRKRKTSVPVHGGDTPTQTSPAASTSAASPVMPSPPPQGFGQSILKKPGYTATDNSPAPLSSVTNNRLTSFHGLGFNDDNDDTDLTFDRDGSDTDMDMFNDAMSFSSIPAGLPATSATGSAPAGGFSTSPRPSTTTYTQQQPQRLTDAPIALAHSPTTVFDATTTTATSPGDGPITTLTGLPPWRLAAPPLETAVNRYCDVVHDRDVQTQPASAELSLDDRVQRVLQHATSHLWARSGAERLCAVVRGFDKPSASYLLSHVAVSLLAWSSQLAAALPQAATHAETYKAKLQQRLQDHAQRREALSGCIELQERTLAPAAMATRMRTTLEASFRDASHAFARDLRAMLLLQQPPRELDGKSHPALAAALVRLKEQIRLFHVLYDGGEWEAARAGLVAKVQAARRSKQRVHSETQLSSSPTPATTTRATGQGQSLAELSRACEQFDLQIITRLSQLNTEILNVFMQYCVTLVDALKEKARDVMREARSGYEAVLAKLAAVDGAKRYVPFSATHRALRGWRQQLCLVSGASRPRLEPLVHALRAALCEDQVRALARVHKARHRTRSASLHSCASSSSLPKSHSVIGPRKASAPSKLATSSQPQPARCGGSISLSGTSASLTMEECLGDGAGACEVGHRCRRVVWRRRYATPLPRGDKDEPRSGEDGQALALEFSLFGAQSLRRAPLSLGASLRGLGTSTHVRSERRGSNGTISTLPVTFLAKVPGTSPVASPVPAVLDETSLRVSQTESTSVYAPCVSPESPPPMPGAATADPWEGFIEALQAWRRDIPAELRPQQQFGDAPLLHLVLETWDELMLATPMHAWLHYHESDYTDAVNRVGTDLLTAQKEWLHRLVSTDAIIAEHVRRVEADVAQLDSHTSKGESVAAVLERVRTESQSIGNALAAARSVVWLNSKTDDT